MTMRYCVIVLALSFIPAPATHGMLAHWGAICKGIDGERASLKLMKSNGDDVESLSPSLPLLLVR